jgi:hypothetical protein
MTANVMPAQAGTGAGRHSDDCNIHHSPSVFRFPTVSVVPFNQKTEGCHLSPLALLVQPVG